MRLIGQESAPLWEALILLDRLLYLRELRCVGGPARAPARTIAPSRSTQGGETTSTSPLSAGGSDISATAREQSRPASAA